MWLEQARNQALLLGQTWEVASWEIDHLGSCHVSKITLGGWCLEKCICESTRHQIQHPYPSLYVLLLYLQLKERETTNFHSVQ